MREILKKPRMIILSVFVIISLLSLSINGLELGIDFTGGTLFQVQLEEAPSPEKMDTIVSIISERLDTFGLSDTKVNSLGEEFISAQIAETDPERIEQLETLLRTQGKFEAMLDGQTLFEGSDILRIFKDPASGYGLTGQHQGATGWQLPFLLNQKAAENFSKSVFHKCEQVGFENFECEQTYFFIDRPEDAVMVIPAEIYSNDSLLLSQGNTLENIPSGTTVDVLLSNAGVPYLLVDQNGLAIEQLNDVNSGFAEKERAIVHSSLGEKDRELLNNAGFEVVVFEENKEEIPWVWSAVGARQVISITPGIANLEPYVENKDNARIFSELVITGSAASQEEALRELTNLVVLLETGSLPIGIKAISKETVSPPLGQEFLSNVWLIGIVALIIVSLIIFFRYRNPKLVIPILITGLSEILIILGFASLIRFNLDLAAVAGILAAVGTGVDHQIIITDEMLRGNRVISTFENRIKKAFFIIFATAATTIATMLPIMIFSFGLGKLRGFALTIIIGVLVGILISRPAFSIMAEHLFKDSKES